MRREHFRHFLPFLILPFIIHYQESFSQTGITKQDYLQTIKTTREKIWQIYHQSLDAWEKTDADLRDDNSPRPDIHWGRLDAFLYQESGDIRYAQAARKVLLEAPYYDNYFAIFILNQIKGSGVLSSQDMQIIETKLVATADRNVKYWTEWGTMNHCSDIANGLTAVMQYLPHHPDFPRWQQKRDINLSVNWGSWSIEDSHNYIPPWLKPLMETAEMLGKEKEFYAMPAVKYYFDYAVQLMTPEGQIVEFGDGGPGGDYTWPWYVAMLEKGASVYGDRKMKWAAHRIFQSNIFGKGQPYIYFAKDLVDAYLWADDSISEEVPTDPSRLVLEDYVGKKVVFRNGWDENATYLFLNYLEDAPFGIDGKEHIINAINVESEKNHHGQADENAIGLLMKNGANLLHDSGYREVFGTDPNGEYRADMYHNKLVVRNGVADRNERLMPFLMDGGRCRQVETKLMHFRRFREVDISRTRLLDRGRGYQWDRLISYWKSQDWFIVLDIVKILKDGEYTLANLFYTQDIPNSDLKNRVWFDTRYRTIGTSLQSGGFAWRPPEHLLKPENYLYKNANNMRLLIYFPEGASFRFGAELIRRCYQTEEAIYSAKADSMHCGEMVVFATLLIPHSRRAAADSIVTSLADLQVFADRNGYAINIPTEDGFVQMSAMLNLEAEYLKENIRPRYNFDFGKNVLGDFITDARYCFVRKRGKQLSYSFLSASQLQYKGQSIFAAQPMVFPQDDGSYSKSGVAKWVAWEDEVDLSSE